MDDGGIVKQCRIENEALRHTRNALLAIIDWPIEGTTYSRKLSGLRFQQRWFQQQVERVFAIEEHDGYMNLVLDLEPKYSQQVKQLQSEHVSLRNRLTQISTRLDRMQPDDLTTFNAICEELRFVIQSLDDHIEREKEILQLAFNQDVGGEGGS